MEEKMPDSTHAIEQTKKWKDPCDAGKKLGKNIVISLSFCHLISHYQLPLAEPTQAKRTRESRRYGQLGQTPKAKSRAENEGGEEDDSRG